MTAEQKVKQVYPEAFWMRGWIYSKLFSVSKTIGWGKTEALAWTNAWRRIQAERKKP